MLALAEVQLGTVDDRPETQFEVWRQIVAETFAPVMLHRPTPSPTDGFTSRLQARRIGDTVLTHLASEPQRVERSADLITRRPAGVYFLNYVTRGTGIAQQDDRHVTARAGELVLLDSDRAFTLDFDASFDQFCLVLPKELLDHLLAAPQLCTAVSISDGTAAGAMLSAAQRCAL